MKKLLLNKGRYALVDDEDFEFLSQWKWYVSNTGYAVRDQYLGKIDGRYKSKTVMMHREILNAPKGMDVDHRNGRRLDNRKENIRICTRSQNLANISLIKRKKFPELPKGVTYNRNPRAKQPYVARISYENRTLFIGGFYTLEEASLAYINRRLELFKEFAPN